MSKGPGTQQEGILRALGGERVWTAEALRWFLFEQGGNRELSHQGKLPNTWNTSFARAVDRLGELGRIKITSRPLESFEECVEHYPGKTLKAEARKLRLQFLPVLLEWSQEKNGLGPKYGAADNEEHHLRLLPKDQVALLEADWPGLEERLRPLYGAAPQAAAANLLKLICKGRYLFQSHDVAANGSLASGVEAACRSGALPDALASDLRSFLERFIPSGTAGALKLKSFIHELADVPRHGQCSLRGETLEYLRQCRNEVVETMDGFREKNGKIRKPWGPAAAEYEYPGPLRKLFDHTVFQDFDFIALASA